MSFLDETRVRFLWALARVSHRLGYPEKAANAYERILRIRPNDPHVIFQRAWWLLEIPDRRTEAIEALRQLLESSPYAFGFFLMGNGLEMEGRHQEAVHAFEKAERIQSPDRADFYFNWGKSLIALRRRAEAAEAFQHAAILEPSNVLAWRILGLIRIELGQWKEAAACQERVMRLEPSLGHALELGRTLYELNRVEEAERVLRQALGLEPQSMDARGLLAQVLSDQNRHVEAIELAREIRGAFPNALPPRLVLANVLSWAGYRDEALREANAAVEIALADPGAHSALGTVYIRMNDGQAALRAFDRMAECIDPELERLPSSWWEWCYAGRGVALSLLGRHDEAMTAFKEALRIDGEFFERCRPFAPFYELSSREMGRDHERQAREGPAES